MYFHGFKFILTSFLSTVAYVHIGNRGAKEGSHVFWMHTGVCNGLGRFPGLLSEEATYIIPRAPLLDGGVGERVQFTFEHFLRQIWKPFPHFLRFSF